MPCREGVRDGWGRARWFTHELGVEWAKAFPGKAPPTGKVLQVVNFAQDEKLVLRDAFLIMKSISKAQDAELPAEEPVAEVAEATEAEELEADEAEGEAVAS